MAKKKSTSSAGQKPNLKEPNEHYEVRRSGVHGYGGFAKRDLEKGKRGELGKVAFPLVAPGERGERLVELLPPVGVPAGVVDLAATHRTVEARVGRHVGLETDDGRDPVTPARLVTALITERGEEEKIWGSMVKQALKRRNPGFNEAFYGFRSFGKLLDEAEARKLIRLDHDEKSGGVTIRGVNTED